jgi:hypothetical protein
MREMREKRGEREKKHGTRNMNRGMGLKVYKLASLQANNLAQVT